MQYFIDCNHCNVASLQPRKFKHPESLNAEKVSWICKSDSGGAEDAVPEVPIDLGGDFAEEVAESRAQLLANSGRRGMGRFPRKCELRGPCGVACG